MTTRTRTILGRSIGAASLAVALAGSLSGCIVIWW